MTLSTFDRVRAIDTDQAERAFEGVADDAIEKVLHGTAARLYGIQ